MDRSDVLWLGMIVTTAFLAGMTAAILLLQVT